MCVAHVGPSFLLLVWLVEDHVAVLWLFRWPTAAGGRTDSMHCADGAAAERRQLLFGCGVMIALLYVALLLCWWLLMVHDDDDDDDTAVGDGSIDDYDAVLFICVGLLLCVRWGHCSREWSAAIDIFCQLV